MANYRKSFNFRNGVQIDDDNFIVNPNGLVGIGTSIPTEFLDVRGNIKVVGHTTSQTLYAGVSTIGNLTIDQGIVATGVITASSFSGSAAGLTGIYAIATDGWIINPANSSISTSYNVGIGTTDPLYSLQIGQDPLFYNGISFESTTGNIRSSGVVTALSFSGSLNASDLTSGTINNSRLPSNINVGIITASSGVYGNLTGTASTANSITSSANIQVNSVNSGFSTSGISTIHNTLHVPGNIGVGTLNPNSQVHIRKSGISSIQLTSDGSNPSIITFGRSVNLTTSNGQLRFGNTSGTYPDSTEQSVDIINYDTGNLNFYLNPGGAGTGSFNWFKPTLDKSMVLTSSGNLGINSNSPSSRLSVVGNASISGVATVGILTVTQSANAKNLISESLRLTGSSSGYVQLASPATAANNTLTLPTSNGLIGEFLRTDGSGALSWSKSIGTIVQGTYSSQTNHTTSWAATGLAATITPSSSNSKIVILINQPIVTTINASGGIRILRNSSPVYNPGQYSYGCAVDGGANAYGSQVASIFYIDSPSTTSATTYSTQGIASKYTAVPPISYFATNVGWSADDVATKSATSQIWLIELP